MPCTEDAVVLPLPADEAGAVIFGNRYAIARQRAFPHPKNRGAIFRLSTMLGRMKVGRYPGEPLVPRGSCGKPRSSSPAFIVGPFRDAAGAGEAQRAVTAGDGEPIVEERAGRVPFPCRRLAIENLEPLAFRLAPRAGHRRQAADQAIDLMRRLRPVDAGFVLENLLRIGHAVRRLRLLA